MNKSGKQRNAAPPVSRNATRLQQTPVGTQSTRIGLCGSRIRGSRQLAPSLLQAVQEAFNNADGQKLLLLPGQWKLGSWPTVDEIAGVAKAAKLPILFEATASKRFYTAVSNTGKRLPLNLYQQFWNGKNATRQAVQELVNECNSTGVRLVHIGGVRLGLLVCGENNILANKQADNNRAYVRYSLASNLFPDVRLIFNGAHTKMGEWGKLERRFEFLSMNGRWFLYATNNKGKSWGSSTLRISYDGRKIATSSGPEPKGAATTEVNGGISWNVILKRPGRKYQIPAAL